jgi:predicted nucleotidyltransferase
MEIDDVVKFVKDRTGWDVVVCSLVGSRNYNLQTENSDFDFIVFVVPPSVMCAEKRSEEIEVGDSHMTIHDLRKLPKLLWDSYPLNLEILFSEKRYMCDEMESLLYGKRENIAGMNRPFLYKFCMKQYDKRLKKLVGTMNAQRDAAEQYQKDAMHAFRMLYILQIFEDTGSFEKATRYGCGSHEKEFLMNVRCGKLDPDYIREELDRRSKHVEEKYRETYCGSEPDSDMFETIREKINSFISRSK